MDNPASLVWFVIVLGILVLWFRFTIRLIVHEGQAGHLTAHHFALIVAARFGLATLILFFAGFWLSGSAHFNFLLVSLGIGLSLINFLSLYAVGYFIYERFFKPLFASRVDNTKPPTEFLAPYLAKLRFVGLSISALGLLVALLMYLFISSRDFSLLELI